MSSEGARPGTPGQLRKVWDFNLGVGGPIVRDRLWFYSRRLRDEGSERSVPGMFANANAGDPTKWTYVADTSRPAVLAASYRILTTRLTAQLTPRNKVSCSGTSSSRVKAARRPASPAAPAASRATACSTPARRRHRRRPHRPRPHRRPPPTATSAIACIRRKWTAPVTNRLLLEAAQGTYRSRWGGKEIPGIASDSLIRVTEQCAHRLPRQRQHSQPDLPLGELVVQHQLEHAVERGRLLRHRQPQHQDRLSGRAALRRPQELHEHRVPSYRVQNGVPDQLTMTINQFPVRQRVRTDAFYAQEQWTLGRMTLQGALRYDHAWSYFPEQTVGPVRFFPTSGRIRIPRASRAITTSRRAAASPTTCSARARRRSRSTSAATSRRRRTAGSSSR